MQPPLPPRPSLDWCLFLDVDGTLVELTDTPFDTQAGAGLTALLRGVSARLDGALALVSGRSIAFLDALFAPLCLPAAGLHGVERRAASGDLHGAKMPAAPLDGARVALRRLVDAHPGTLLEDKGQTIGIHYRMAPRAEAAMREAVAGIAGMLGGGYHVQDGNMMLELKPRGCTKGLAIAQFLEEPPFAGRTPVFVGDDLTDLDGFEVVERAGGVSVGVGARVQGRYQLSDPAAVRAWLGALVAPP